MRDLLFEESCVEGTLEQLCTEISKAGYADYCLLGIGDGGINVVDRLEKKGDYKEKFTCPNVNELTPDFLKSLKGKNILICEDTVNTGRTIRKILKSLRESAETSDLKILSLTMRQNSPIVPNFYAFELADDNRVYFPWSRHPIRSFPKGIVRKIFHEDCSKTFSCGEERIDKYPLSEYYNNQQNKNARVYLVEENGNICSMIQFFIKKIEHFKGIFLDVIAVSTEYKEKKYASTLLRLMTSYSIHHDQDFILGYAFDRPGLVDMYKKKGFEVLGSIEDPNYGKLHKIVKILDKEHEDMVLAELKKV